MLVESPRRRHGSITPHCEEHTLLLKKGIFGHREYVLRQVDVLGQVVPERGMQPFVLSFEL